MEEFSSSPNNGWDFESSCSDWWWRCWQGLFCCSLCWWLEKDEERKVEESQASQSRLLLFPKFKVALTGCWFGLWDEDWWRDEAWLLLWEEDEDDEYEEVRFFDDQLLCSFLLNPSLGLEVDDDVSNSCLSRLDSLQKELALLPFIPLPLLWLSLLLLLSPSSVKSWRDWEDPLSCLQEDRRLLLLTELFCCLFPPLFFLRPEFGPLRETDAEGEVIPSKTSNLDSTDDSSFVASTFSLRTRGHLSLSGFL